MPREELDDADLERVDELAAEGSSVLDLVDQLPASQRQALQARVVDERDYHEIAMALGASDASVRQNVSRALRWLRAHREGEQA